MSAIGPKRTWTSALQMSAFYPKADIGIGTDYVRKVLSVRSDTVSRYLFRKKDIACSLIRCVSSDGWQHCLSCNRNMGAIHDPALIWDIWFFSDSFDDAGPVLCARCLRSRFHAVIH